VSRRQKITFTSINGLRSLSRTKTTTATGTKSNSVRMWKRVRWNFYLISFFYLFLFRVHIIWIKCTHSFVTVCTRVQLLR
jgi:hypothetical protein